MDVLFGASKNCIQLNAVFNAITKLGRARIFFNITLIGFD